MQIYNDGHVKSGRFVKVLYQEGTGDFAFRFGITTTKKIGNAVARNRSRRLLREIIRKQLFLLKNNISVIIVVKRSFVGRSYDEISRDLEKVFNDASFYQVHPGAKKFC